MIQHAFIEEQGLGRLNVESKCVKEELERRGVPVTLFHKKRMLRKHVPLTEGSFVCGDIPCCETAMTQLGLPIPEPDDYPECLRPFLHRRVWKSTLRDLIHDFDMGGGKPVFVKPADKLKRFTGFVFDSISAISSAHGSSRRDPVYCADVVTWLTEYRVYVTHGVIQGILNYDGDKKVMIDATVAEAAIAALREVGKLKAGFAIDFGVLADGRTALIEMNDGYAIGNYGLDPAKYTDMLLTRWEELAAQKKTPYRS